MIWGDVILNRVYNLSRKKAKSLMTLWLEYENCTTPREAIKLRKEMLEQYEQLKTMSRVKS